MKILNVFWTPKINIYKKGDSICSGCCPKGGDRFAEIIADLVPT
jgi:hypothetical protein